MTRQPMPDWTRKGETWRVEPENGWVPIGDGICNGTGCRRPAAAFRPNHRMNRNGGFGLCQLHMRACGMWIEDGRVVSWCLRP